MSTPRRSRRRPASPAEVRVLAGALIVFVVAAVFPRISLPSLLSVSLSPLLLVGLALVVAGAVVFALARRRAAPVDATRGAVPLSRLDPSPVDFISTGVEGFDRVLGGGLVRGVSYLLAGPPGCGKSTLLGVVARGLVARGPILYASGEESADQVAARLRRLRVPLDRLYLVTSDDFSLVVSEARRLRPLVVVVDSVQRFRSADLRALAGSPDQVSAVAAALVRLAHDPAAGSPTLLAVSHVTKSGVASGPNALLHDLDVVLYFVPAEDAPAVRVLSAPKNRYGPGGVSSRFRHVADGLESLLPVSESSRPAPARVRAS